MRRAWRVACWLMADAPEMTGPLPAVGAMDCGTENTCTAPGSCVSGGGAPPMGGMSNLAGGRGREVCQDLPDVQDVCFHLLHLRRYHRCDLLIVLQQLSCTPRQPSLPQQQHSAAPTSALTRWAAAAASPGRTRGCGCAAGRGCGTATFAGPATWQWGRGRQPDDAGSSEGRDVDCGEKQADKHCMGSCDSASAPAVSLRDACACCALPPAAPAPVAAAGTGAAAPPPLAVVATPPVAIIAALLPVPLPLAWPLLFEGAGRRGTGRVSKGRAWQQRRAPAAVQSTAA